jgi:hypothetical protein
MGVHAVRIDPKSKLGLFVSHVVPGVLRPMRVLWNEIIGFLFIVLAVLGIPSLVRALRDLDTPQGSPARVVLSVLFVLVMAYFGVTSFLRARRINRS